jgi:hypothetical protein
VGLKWVGRAGQPGQRPTAPAGAAELGPVGGGQGKGDGVGEGRCA